MPYHKYSMVLVCLAVYSLSFFVTPAFADEKEAAAKKEFLEVLNLLIADGKLADAASKRLFDKYVWKGNDPGNDYARYGDALSKLKLKVGTASIEVDEKTGKEYLVHNQAESRQRVCEIELSAEPVENALDQVIKKMAEALVNENAPPDGRCVFVATTESSGGAYAVRTNLLQAAEEGNIKIIEILLKQGADINAADPATLQTPLHKAVYGLGPGITTVNRTEAVRLLITGGADVNARDNNGKTPLQLAVAGQNKESVQLLIAGGADVNARDKNGETPLQLAVPLAVEKGQQGVVELLVEGGADVYVTYKGILEEKTLVQSLLGYCGPGDNPEWAAAAEKLIRYLGRHGITLDKELKPLLTDKYSYHREEKILKLASLMSPPPAVGEEARRAAIQGKTALKHASNMAGFEEAEEHFQKAVDLAPWWPEAYFNLGLVLEKLREYDTAKKNFELYIYAVPEAADIASVKEKIYELEYLHKRKQEAERWINAGADYYNAGNVYEAVNAYKKAIELDPDDPIAHANLGDVYRRLERHKEAVVELREALRLGKKDAFVYAALGRAYKNLGEGKKAIDVMEEGVHELGEVGKLFDDRYGFLRQWLGHYYKEDGQYEKALANFEEALKHVEQDVDKQWLREKIDQLKRRLGR